MTELQLQFFRATQFWHYLVGAAKWGSIVLLILLTVFSGTAWFRTQIALNHLEQQRNDIIRNLTLSANQLMKLDNELDALASIVKAFKDTRTSQDYYTRFSNWRRWRRWW